MAQTLLFLCSLDCPKQPKNENSYWKYVSRHICSLICVSNSDIDPIFFLQYRTKLNIHAKKGLCFLLCLCNLNYLVVSCNLVPLQLLNKLHFVLNYCGEMAGHDRIKKPAAAAMKYVAISYCSIYDEKKRRERNNIFIQK